MTGSSDRQIEYTKWAASRPGVPGSQRDRRQFRRPLQRPILTMFGFLAFAVVIGGGAWAMFGAGGPEVSADHDAVVATLNLEGGICCIQHFSSDGGDYVLAIAEEPSGVLISDSRDVTLRMIEQSEVGLEEIASIEAPYGSRLPWTLAVDDDTAYVPLAARDGSDFGIWMLDVSDPTAPDEIAVFDTDSEVTELAAPGNDLLVAHISGEFQFYDASAQDQLNLIWSFRQPISAVQRMIVDLEAGRLYDREVRANRIRISDISDLENASPLGRHLNEAGASSAPHRPGNVIGDANERLERTAPRRHFQDFAVSGDTMYAAVSDIGLEIIDVSDPTAPSLINRIALDSRVVRTAIAGETLHVVAVNEESRERLDYEVHTYDLDEPTEPQMLSTVDDIQAAPGRQALETDGRYIFLGLSDTIVMIDTER